MSIISLLEKNNCIYKKNIKLSSGLESKIYYDIKKAAGIPEVFNFIINELKLIIPKNSCIIGVSTGGIPYAAALAYDYKTNFAYIRENKKKYGMNKSIEGFIDFSKPIYIIDDVCTTGKSILRAKSFLPENYKYNLVCIIDRGLSELNIQSIEKIF
tara:strand:+ start:253 stop:720 length:468 start_codon:yes stop_codon:yes gene_type:complete